RFYYSTTLSIPLLLLPPSSPLFPYTTLFRSNGFFGMTCENTIRSFHVDVALLSTTTVQGLSLYTQDEQVVRAKQAMMAIARKKILLVDSSKFHFSALIYVATLTDFDAVLLTGEVDSAITQTMREAGVKLHVV